MSCPVCIEGYNKTVRKAVACPMCTEQACSACTRKYILSNNHDAKCMHCNKEWDHGVLCDLFPAAFVTGPYKEHRRKVLLDREKSRLPETQVLVERVTLDRRLDAQYDELENQMEALRLQQRRLRRVQTRLQSMTKEQLEAIPDLDTWAAEDHLIPSGPRRQLRQFTHACPATDCRGFLSSQWKCALCEVWVCPDCHEVKGATRDAPHECDPAIKANAEAIAKETRPCPNCAAAIFRVSGCNQMWCTQCHTSFDWVTGEKITRGFFHNPHMAEWQREHGGEPPPGADQCQNDLPSYYDLQRKLERVGLPVNSQAIDLAYHALRFTVHTADVTVRGLPNPHADDDLEALRESLRIAWMLKEVSEDDWMARLASEEKKRYKKIQQRMVWEMLVDAMRALFRRVMLSRARAEAEDIILVEMENLRQFANKCLADISKRLGCSCKPIPVGWREVA